MKAGQMTPFRLLLFKLYLYVILVLVFGNRQSSFPYGPLLWLNLVCKVPAFLDNS